MKDRNYFKKRILGTNLPESAYVISSIMLDFDVLPVMAQIYYTNDGN